MVLMVKGTIFVSLSILLVIGLFYILALTVRIEKQMKIQQAKKLVEKMQQTAQDKGG